MKMSWKIGAIIGLVAVIAMTAMGISYAANGNPNPSGKSLCTFSWVEPNDDNYIRAGIDPGDNGNDPSQIQIKGVDDGSRYSANAAQTTAGIITITSAEDTIILTISDAYPGYLPTVFFGLSNKWNTPGIVQSINIQNPSSLAVSMAGIKVNDIIESNTEAVGAFSILVGDNVLEGQVQSITASIVVTQYTAKGTLNIVTPSLPDGEIGRVYTQSLSAAMGNIPYSWSKISGTLPTGLTLGSDGVISGTPTTAGTYSFTAKVTDDTGDTATKAFSIKIVAGPTITTSSLAAGKTGKSYSQTLAVSGGVAPYTWSKASGSLPDGLTLNGATGIISGTPTKVGTYNFAVKVTDVYGAISPNKSLSIVVK